MSASDAVSALVLAGGGARRMDGEKLSRALGGRSLAAHAVDLARGCSDDVILLAGDRALPDDVDARDLRRVDDWATAPGPLSALGAGLQAARHPWALLLACDMPFVDVAAVARLRAAAADAADDADVVAYRGADGWEPFCALYRRDRVEAVSAHLAAGGRSLRSYLEAAAVTPADAPPTGRDFLFNVNTPEDLARARALAADGTFTDTRAGEPSGSTTPAHRGPPS